MHLGTFDGENDQRNEKKFSESQKSLFDELRGLQKSNSAANLATSFEFIRQIIIQERCLLAKKLHF